MRTRLVVPAIAIVLAACGSPSQGNPASDSRIDLSFQEDVIFSEGVEDFFSDPLKFPDEGADDPDQGTDSPIDPGPPDIPTGDPSPADADATAADPGPSDPGADVPPVPAQTLAAFDALLAASDAAGLAAFVAAWDGPVCEGSTCLFVVRAPGASTVEVLGAFGGWTDPLGLVPVPFASGTWHGRVAVPAAAWSRDCTEYKLRVDGTWMMDPSHPYIRFGGYGPNSAACRALASRIAWMQAVHSPQLGNDRDVYVYLPAAYFADRAARFPVLYLQDGFNVFSNPLAPFGTWDVEVTADALAAQGRARPVVMVGIDTKDRMNEYLYCSIDLGDGTVVTPRLAPYATFLVETLKPAVDARFRTLPGRGDTGVAGSSLGGISALWIAWKHADTFGLVGSFSGSYWIGEDAPVRTGGPAMRQIIAENAEGVAPGSIRIYLDAGDTDDGGASYGADAWAESDWTRNALIRLGWSNRPEWDTDADAASAPADLPMDTPVADVPSLAWSAQPPAGYAGWKDYLGTGRDLLALVGHGHQHNEAAWRQRFGAALVFLFPGDAP